MLLLQFVEQPLKQAINYVIQCQIKTIPVGLWFRLEVRIKAYACYICIIMYMYMYMYVCMCVCVCVYVCACVRACVCVCMYVCMYVYTR